MHYLGTTTGVLMGDTWSLDYSSNDVAMRGSTCLLARCAAYMASVPVTVPFQSARRQIARSSFRIKLGTFQDSSRAWSRKISLGRQL